MDRQAHWDEVYRTRPPTEVSWYQPMAGPSLRIIMDALPDRADPVLDVGGGASSLAAQLAEAGFRDVSVLDLSRSALDIAQARMGRVAERITWMVGDVCLAALAPARYALWHDRAVFHFLTSPEDRAAYLGQLRHALRPDGMAVIATFAEDGPTRCSGLEVRRYSAEGLAAELGEGFRLLRTEREEHRTPSGAGQAFMYAVFQRTG